METKQRAPFKDRIIPWYFVMAFMVIFAVNGLFLYLATSTHRGVVTEDAYEKGRDYTRIVEEVRKQKAEDASPHESSTTSPELSR